MSDAAQSTDQQCDISQLLFEIGERRAQAVALARAMERSVFVPTRLNDEVSDIGGLLDEEEEDDDERPPDSFLEDFTRDFVDLYYTPPDPQGTQKIRDLCHKTGDEEDEKDEVEDDCGVSKIDYVARHRIWSRIGRHEEVEESRIVALVERAALQYMLPFHAGESVHLEESVHHDEPVHIERSVHPEQSVHLDDPLHLDDPPQPPCFPPWTPNEWELWAAYKASSESTAALDWVHALQPDAWAYGFHDAQQGTKVVRTYSGLALTLHGYADGNVKRTADVVVDGAPALATTLFFDNGDWSCTLVGTGPPRSYYHYCHEQVWHEQCAARNVYRYADGRTETV
ncbi:hypothetical protein GGI20_002111 [Coemansia sp. BCRC 34301]|nr:hypothetical protein GGI20_002111 [Coemansia sp. BCRC 34301]